MPSVYRFLLFTFLYCICIQLAFSLYHVCFDDLSRAVAPFAPYSFLGAEGGFNELPNPQDNENILPYAEQEEDPGYGHETANERRARETEHARITEEVERLQYACDVEEREMARKATAILGRHGFTADPEDILSSIDLCLPEEAEIDIDLKYNLLRQHQRAFGTARCPWWNLFLRSLKSIYPDLDEVNIGNEMDLDWLW